MCNCTKIVLKFSRVARYVMHFYHRIESLKEIIYHSCSSVIRAGAEPPRQEKFFTLCKVELRELAKLHYLFFTTKPITVPHD